MTSAVPGRRGPVGADSLSAQASIGLLNRQLKQAMAAEDADTAADLASRLADLRPDTAGWQRRAANLLIQAGKPDEAIGFATRAMELEPDNTSHRMVAGRLMNLAQDFSGAMMALFVLLETENQSAELYHQLAVAAEGLGDASLAVNLETKAVALDSGNVSRVMALANLLARHAQADAAISLLLDYRDDPERGPVVRRCLSGIYLQQDEDERALAEIDAAIAIDPERSDYRLHRISVLRRIGDLETARTELRDLLLSDPQNLRLKRNLVSLHTHAGEHEEALREGAELLALAPHVEEYVACMRSMLEAREARAGKLDLGDIAALKRGAETRRTYVTRRSSRQAAGAKVRIIAALVLRDIRSRHGRNRLGFLWSLLEPVMHIAILAVVFIVTMRTNPPLGDNYLLFYLTGVAPFLLFNHISSSGGHGIAGGRSMLQLPGIAPADIVLSKAVVELFIASIVLLLFGGMFLSIGVPGLPRNPAPVLAALGLSTILGIGTAAIYATLYEFGKVPDMIFKALFRAMYMTSGIFFLPSAVPETLRAIIVWNPFVHVIDLARTGYYPFYDGEFVDLPYTIVSTLFLAVAGLAMITLATPIMRSAK